MSVKYNLHSSDKDIPRYIKMHVDDGLNKLNLLFKENKNMELIELVESNF